MKEKILILKVLFVLFWFSPNLYANSFYGMPSLRDLSGVELFTHLSGEPELKKIEQEIKDKLKSRLENAPVPLTEFSEKSGALKFLLTGFKKSENDFFIYASMQLHQRAYLAISHEYMDCQTWDTWKIGVFNIDEIFLVAEDMAREFANDFISANSF
jgi:hypothetical protein